MVQLDGSATHVSAAHLVRSSQLTCLEGGEYGRCDMIDCGVECSVRTPRLGCAYTSSAPDAWAVTLIMGLAN